MSRIGKLPITVPAGVTVDIAPDNTVTVKGPKGTLTQTFVKSITIKKEDGVVTLERRSEEKRQKALHGLTRSLLNNMVQGVLNGFEKKLEINGVGYKAALDGTKLVLSLGYSHPLEVLAPEGITFEVPTPTTILVKGYDKQAVGQIAAQIREFRKPEPYLGKGVKYSDETIRRKEGKAGA
ncbi:MAG: 50S ribosomal protein L6 [Clostridia bacterium]|jgi:large subunit ribosomal protein L6|nr:50S ribosomal protein L6 [Clostridia bacterium]NLF36735.1 50S ribosomal protein L6 [Clostridiaceae bacterium]MDD3092539.1 50S ribosomal protein L6 [Clostridia bacterium]MDD3971244.1 50S ribosomal protein L6 [Clostridia bacterium]MDD4542185.1 50S ribosomal protein L6 [Clostridia bacterium]